MKEIFDHTNLLLNEIQRDIITKMVNEADQIFEKALREKAVPPVKGKITRGKIIWRGIRAVEMRNLGTYKKWLEQRGSRISPIIVFECTAVTNIYTENK